MAWRTVWRICSATRWWSAFGKRQRGKNGKAGSASSRRSRPAQLRCRRTNRLWLRGNTEQRTGEGKLYVCAAEDMFSGQIVGYSIDSRVKSRLAVNTLNNAAARRCEVADYILHTDCGSQFRSRCFVHALNRHRMVG